jgi:MFS family permease
LAVGAIIYAIRHLPGSQQRQHEAFRLKFREALSGLERVMPGIGAFELGNVAATLMILRATELLTPTRGMETATSLALWLYVGYNGAATLASVPAGRVADRRRGVNVMMAGVALFAIAYVGLAVAGPTFWLLAVWFITAGIAIGCVETAENSTVALLAPATARGSAFGLLAAAQSFGNLAASGVAGMLWTLFSPTVAFGYSASWMGVSVVTLFVGARRR